MTVSYTHLDVYKRQEYAGLPIRVLDLQLHRDNRAVVFQRGDFDGKPFTLNLGCADHHRITGDPPNCA